MEPEVIRYSSVLLFVLSCAIVYRLARMLSGHMTGMVVAASYAAIGLAHYLSLFLRGYVLALVILCMILLLIVRHNRSPRLRNSIRLSVLLAIGFYTTYTIATAYVAIGGYLLVVNRKHRGWWLFTALIAGVLMLPGIVRISNLVLFRLSGVDTTDDLVTLFDQQHLRTLQQLIGARIDSPMFWIWVAGTVISFFIYVYFTLKQRSSRSLMTSGWFIGIFVATLTIGPVLGLNHARYFWWILPGIALWYGIAIANLPSITHTGIVGMMVFGMFMPLPKSLYTDKIPFEQFLPLLRDSAQPGDVLVIDPSCSINFRCGRAEDIYYYFNLTYFEDQMVTKVKAPADQRRIWHLMQNGLQDPTLEAEIANGRIASKFIGPPDFFFQLYEAPPDPEGILFENGVRFHGLDVIRDDRIMNPPIILHEGESLTLRVWWSIDRPVGRDLSRLMFIGEGANQPPLSAVDGPPTPSELRYPHQSLPHQTSAWQPRQLYVEEVNLQVPREMNEYIEGVPTGYNTLDVYLALYQWWDGQRIYSDSANEDGLLSVLPLQVLAW